MHVYTLKISIVLLVNCAFPWQQENLGKFTNFVLHHDKGLKIIPSMYGEHLVNPLGKTLKNKTCCV